METRPAVEICGEGAGVLVEAGRWAGGRGRRERAWGVIAVVWTGAMWRTARTCKTYRFCDCVNEVTGYQVYVVGYFVSCDAPFFAQNEI